ncbi:MULTISPECIES: LysR family transcriptional regulator [Streptomyces]|uniref:LysR family transcriptional regulator n=3 Tax=Streptomyces TaxID=1883 RepID=A0ABD5JFU9_9ACTN|nr:MULTISPECIES: LysR family transcriptional regulator [Streptomyces]MEE4587272.1 LysR family transcriptional regulator [Streptomyces sp. DSM 41602]WTA86432.1 LysR family transcriptional regulator [Streptomyces antimycoticus]KUL66451.1 LysR family transcriptional regulator [Streptomyces violaceusniger]QTI90308.1 LysR family transcriptional regulator [Streptomyces sp. AgN23]RSS47222.1 LysR family transcriptional regulator [Streptomyces sp. WAC05858]
MDISSTGLRVLQQIAESGSFTAAAARLGYTQSAVSRQAVSLERSAGTTLFDRRPDGVRLTPAGLTLLRHARTILDCLAAAESDLTGTVPRTELVRLGLFLSAGAIILPAALTRLTATDPQITVTTTEGTTPALIRALRAGSIDLAVLTSRPPHRPLDSDSPRLHVDTVADTELVVAVPSTGKFAGRTTVHVDELVDAAWIATPSSNSEPLLGVWPGLPGRPHIVHRARDWLTKLQLVAGGFGVTTVPLRLSPVLPPGVSLVPVEGAPPEIRRVLVARLPGHPTPAITTVTRAITSTI